MVKATSTESVEASRALREDEHHRVDVDHGLASKERFVIGLEGFIAICGLGGGAFMITHPISAMSLRYLQGTWFHTWRWPGVALFFFVGVCPVVVLIAALRRYRLASLGHVVTGLGLIAWVVLEAAWIVVNPGLQLAVGAIGAVILVLGTRELRATSLVARRKRPS